MPKIDLIGNFYNDARTLIPLNLRNEIVQVCSSGIRVDNRSNTNADLSTKLKLLGWRGETRHAHAIGRLDFIKDSIGIEVQLRQGTNLIYDLLKLELDYRDRILLAGVIITYDQSVPAVGKHGQDASVQKLDNIWVDFVDSGVMNLKVPIWGLGLRA